MTSCSMCAEGHKCDLVTAGHGEACRLTDLCSKAPAGWHIQQVTPVRNLFLILTARQLAAERGVLPLLSAWDSHCEHLLWTRQSRSHNIGQI